MNRSLVLSFDLDDTLWPVGPVIAAAEQDLWKWLLERHPHAVRGHSVESLRAMRALTAERHPEHGHDLTFLRHRALKDLFEAAGTARPPVAAAPAAENPAVDVDALADEALEVFFAARNRVEFYDDVRPSLQRLHARYRLFALSNGNADLQRCGIAALVRRPCHRELSGRRQTGRAHFCAAGGGAPESRRTKCCTSAMIRVTDVVGATQAGMQAVWLNRDARAWPKQLAAAAAHHHDACGNNLAPKRCMPDAAQVGSLAAPIADCEKAVKIGIF